MKALIKSILPASLVNKYQLFRRMQLTKEPKEILAKRKVFYRQFVQKGALCFDVGANIGNRIEPLLSIGARVVAVEPQSSCYTFLEYKYGKQIEIVTKGLGEAEGVQEFHISESSAISSFSKDWINAVKEERFSSSNWDKSVEVEMTTLDKLIEQYGTPCFIKIDVEGFELNVLRGLSQPIKMISFEYTVPEQTEQAVKCIDQIEKNGGAIQCNYSIGESMHLEFAEWQSPESFKHFLSSDEFIRTRFGDIYVRNTSVYNF
jgi:FkbM family methyltransferase